MPKRLLLPILIVFVASPVFAQEIPEADLAAAKAKAEAAAKPQPAPVAAPSVTQRVSWWQGRSATGKKVFGGGAVTGIVGLALTAYGSSSANNAIDRRKTLQIQPFLTPEQRTDFRAQSDTVKLGRTLHLSGLILLGTGGLAMGIGGMI